MPLKPVKIEFPYTMAIYCERNQQWEAKTFKTQAEADEHFADRHPPRLDYIHADYINFTLGIDGLPPCSC